MFPFLETRINSKTTATRGVALFFFSLVFLVYCLFISLKSQICKDGLCQSFTQWSSFSQCSVSCGGGTKYRTRRCLSLPPNNLKRNCYEDTISCNTKPCSKYSNNDKNI